MSRKKGVLSTEDRKTEQKQEAAEQETLRKREQKLWFRRTRTSIRWDKLDNTANLFPAIAGESMTNTYRISVTLKENIDPEKLQEALDMVLPKFDGFNVRLRRGIFWYYFEENGKPAPKVREEVHFPCRYIKANKNHSYLFTVTYYEKRINLEVFHVLTDGMGGLNFIRELTYQYLRLTHPDLKGLPDNLSSGTSLNREDSFTENYRESRPSGFERKKAYLIKGPQLDAGEFGLMHGYLPVGQLKKVTHEYGVSINEYLVAVFIWATYESCLKKRPAKYPIRVAVPVNLRPYYDSITTKNFFVMVSAEFEPTEEECTFEDVLRITRESLRSQITKEHLEDLFSYSVSNQKNLFLRPVPLSIKNKVMKLVYTQSALANTTTITNIGNLTVEEDYRPYIDGFHANIAMSKGQLIKGCICSYGDTLVFTFSSVLKDVSVERAFFRRIAADGVDVRIETNGVWYE